mmetsp:Transcript_15974/g.40200  ORF Transcript_15974/g.40200 Transcript_15974/m.40200 type:complete len:265 (-) Transcript_15974:240-1034(-)
MPQHAQDDFAGQQQGLLSVHIRRVRRQDGHTPLELRLGAVLGALHQEVAHVLVVDDGEQPKHLLDGRARDLPLHVLEDEVGGAHVAEEARLGGARVPASSLDHDCTEGVWLEDADVVVAKVVFKPRYHDVDALLLEVVEDLVAPCSFKKRNCRVGIDEGVEEMAAVADDVWARKLVSEEADSEAAFRLDLDLSHSGDRGVHEELGRVASNVHELAEALELGLVGVDADVVLLVLEQLLRKVVGLAAEDHPVQPEGKARACDGHV